MSAVDFGWQGLPLRRLIEARYHVPVSVLNDSQAAAMGEYTYGGVHAARSNLVVINVRYGIGAGIILNGEIFHGDGGGRERSGTSSWCARAARPATAATWGAWRRWPARTPSSSARTLAHHAESSVLAGAPEDITIDAIQRAFAAGDPLARQVVLEAGRFMGMAISSLVGTLSIRRIVLTGDMTRFGPRSSTRSWRRWRRRCWRAWSRHPRGDRAARPARDRPRRLGAHPQGLLASLPPAQGARVANL